MPRKKGDKNGVTGNRINKEQFERIMTGCLDVKEKTIRLIFDVTKPTLNAWIKETYADGHCCYVTDENGNIVRDENGEELTRGPENFEEIKERFDAMQSVELDLVCYGWTKRNWMAAFEYANKVRARGNPQNDLQQIVEKINYVSQREVESET